MLRKAGTERAFTGEYTDTKTVGVYRCRACQTELFQSETKFDSHCGWPSFYAPLAEDRVEYIEDTSMGMKRVEVRCANCGSHLGHVFDDGYGTPTGQRYCINSISMTLEPPTAEEISLRVGQQQTSHDQPTPYFSSSERCRTRRRARRAATRSGPTPGLMERQRVRTRASQPHAWRRTPTPWSPAMSRRGCPRPSRTPCQRGTARRPPSVAIVSRCRASSADLARWDADARRREVASRSTAASSSCLGHRGDGASRTAGPSYVAATGQPGGREALAVVGAGDDVLARSCLRAHPGSVVLGAQLR